MNNKSKTTDQTNHNYGVFPAFHALRISHKAFMNLQGKRLAEMQKGNRLTLSQIANGILEN